MYLQEELQLDLDPMKLEVQRPYTTNLYVIYFHPLQTWKLSGAPDAARRNIGARDYFSSKLNRTRPTDVSINNDGAILCKNIPTMNSEL